ncbi:peptidase family M48-domain-containing protein [Chytriomyces sp. MP71]|nr:peptidase family M48-domain-containing protein [Chytriomyces sp. MP71]
MFRAPSLARCASSTSRPSARRQPASRAVGVYEVTTPPELSRFRSGSRFNRGGAPFYQSQRTWYIVGGFAVLGGVYYTSHLETVPISGRTRFMDMTVQQELAMGKQAYKEIMHQYGHLIVPNYHPAAISVQKIARRIIEVSGIKDVEWEIYLIDHPEMNAFVIPGGKVFVFSGMLPVVQNDDGLAAVLGHEIAHQLARHSAEKLSALKIVSIGQLLLTFVFDAGGLARLFADVGLMRPFSRLCETEADYIGLKLMAQACYNPDAAVEMWKRMKMVEKGQPSQFLSTHPSHETRIEKISEWLPEARQIREASNCRETVQLYDLFSRSVFGRN